MDIHSICRICLEYLQNGSAYDLFLIPGLSKKLCMCTALSVEPQDGFPKNICGVCYTRLNDMSEFQKLCVDSVQKFQDLVARHTVECVPSSTFDIMEAPSTEPIEGVELGLPDDDDDHLNFDPLLTNHKMEMIENEEDVFKMLETVDKEDEEVEAKVEDEEINNDNEFTEESSEDDRESDDDFQFAEVNDDDDDDSDSDDDKPLAVRMRNIKKECKDDNDDELSRDGKDPKMKPKRKRIPAAERHLHRIIDCHICHQKFKKTKNYEEHMKYHNDKLPFQCEVENCKRGFTTAYGLRLHVEHCHNETVEKIPCTQDGCDMKFTRRRILNWHLKRVHKIAKEDVPKTYPCTECEKVFKCPMALKKHMFKHTGKELPFPCNICGKRFVINSALKDHLMRHAGIKNYVCPYCGVGKTTRQEWNTHIATHNTEKKFKCHLCPHASHNKQNLRMHVRVVHEKIKDYACQYCGKTFGKSNACKMHEMTHTGEKRCECKVCGKRFLYPKGLTKHLKTHEKRVLRAIEVYRKRQVEMGELPAEQAESIPELPNPENTQESHQKVADEIFKVCADFVNSIPKDPRRVERVDIADLAGTADNPIPQMALPSWSPQINFMMKEGKFTCPDCGQGFNGSGECSKPLFERGDVIANSKEDDTNSKSIKESISEEPSSSRSPNKHNVKKAPSPVVTHRRQAEYKHRGCCGKLPIRKSSNNYKSTSTTTNKLPYYRDEIRERDRLHRLYVESRRYKSRSLSPASPSQDRSRRRNRSTSRNRHRNYSPYKRTRSDSDDNHRSRRSRSRTQTPHRDRPRHKKSSRRSRSSHSPCCSRNRHLNNDRRSSRSRSSPSQHSKTSGDRENKSEAKNKERQDSMQVPPPSMYIPVPVPVPDYAYSFPHWSLPPNPWAPHIPNRGPPAPYGFSPYGFPVMPPPRPIQSHQIRYPGPPPSMA